MYGWIIMFVVFMILSLISLGLWTYRDASNRGLNPGLWTVIVLLVPNLIGLIIYFLVGRKNIMIKCSNCNNNIPQHSKYCMSCGASVANIEENKKKSTSKFIIGFIVCFIMFIISFVGFTVNLLSDDGFEFRPNLSILLFETNTANKWNVSYYTSSDEFSKTINITDNSPANLYVEASCEEGELYLNLKQGAIEEIVDISQIINTKKIDLSKFNNGNVELKLLDKECKKVKFKSHFE
jgi:uncharacterized membrane protein YeiB